MAYAAHRSAYHHPATDAALESKRYEDESLDPVVLESVIMQSPHDVAFRKDSFAHSTTGVISPPDSHQWNPEYAASALSVEPAANAYHDEPSHLYASQPPHHVQPHPYAPPPPAWSSYDRESTGVAFLPPSAPQPYDASHFLAAQRANSTHGAFGQPQPQPPQHFTALPAAADAGFMPASQAQTPISPQAQDHMAFAQQELENGQKRVRPVSPSRPFLGARDGIRKKNGRIEIPPERNIATIDMLMQHTKDEEQLRELKQQKRLLRNREAALASRQRKKKHTEDLEVKEKGYTSQITLLENKVAELSMERERGEHEIHALRQRHEQFQRHINAMENEKRETMMKHNEETSSLRRKLRALNDQLEYAPIMSAAPSSTGYTDFNADMEALSMGSHDFDHFLFANELQPDVQDDFSFDPKPEPVHASPMVAKRSMATTGTPHPAKKQHDDQPVASGLLFFLLLCGAFMASKPAGSQPADMPKVPADVRAAAPTVLSNLLSESSGPNGLDHARSSMPRPAPAAPAPSGLTYSAPRPGRLDQLHRKITAPTRQQEIDQAYSLTPAEYASLTDFDVPVYNNPPRTPLAHGEPATPRRRNLAEALASMEQDTARDTNKAAVYTRSLLWDQIPADVVKQFKAMVRDHNEIEAREKQQPPQPQGNHEADGFKLEL